MRHYILKNGIPTEEPDEAAWLAWLKEPKNRIVESTKIPEHNCTVLTDFFGVDKGQGASGDLVLFETIVIGGPQRGYKARYCTLGEAKRSHFAIVDAVREMGAG